MVMRPKSDVVGTYDAMVVTTRREPWICNPRISSIVKRSFSDHLTELGAQVHRIAVESDCVLVRFTIAGDANRTPKAYIASAKKFAVPEIRERIRDELPSWRFDMGLFANPVMVRTVGEGIKRDDIESFRVFIGPDPSED